ncbi:allergen Tha p 1 [Microplitis demolitor]|uniref:allergen Tha p 1 n=1 Tax=Microplitis demolitor TaxID=69319 RepID=UPI0006D50474|nr:allergen Tha p 1 [Microplitis demolitor]
MHHIGKIIVAVLAAISFKLNTKTYSDQIESEIKNSFLSRFFCVIGEDSCDEFGERIKRHMSDILENQCSKCSLQMQAVGCVAIPYLQNEFPDLWEFLLKKYDNNQSQKLSMDSYFLKAYNCLIFDINCDSSLQLLRKALPFLLKYNICPGCDDISMLFNQQLKLAQKKFPTFWKEVWDKYAL